MEDKGQERHPGFLQGGRRRQGAGNFLSFFIYLFIFASVACSPFHPAFSVSPSLSPSRAGSGTALLQLNETDGGVYCSTFLLRHTVKADKRSKSWWQAAARCWKKTKQNKKRNKPCCAPGCRSICYRRDLRSSAAGLVAVLLVTFPRPFAVIDGACACACLCVRRGMKAREEERDEK